MDENKLNLMIEEYKKNIDLYKEFCDSVAFLLKKLLNNNFQYQVVSSRVKEENSLRKKLNENKATLNITSITELDDLVGCRIIFYLDSEIKKFMNVVYKEFEVVKNNLRYSEDDYNAQHLIIKLKNDRLSLAEYSEFKHLKCEIQLTTVLFHSWSEVSHNITYKNCKNIVEFDQEKFEFFRNQFKEIMKNYIKPANLKFEFINQEYLNLLEGKEIFTIDFFNSIITCENRREIHGKLLLLNQYIKKYGDKSPNEYKITDFLKLVIYRSSELKDSKDILGFTYEHYHIVETCIEILTHIRYQNINEVLLILEELAMDDENNIRKSALKAIKEMSKYNFEIIKKYGIYVQQLILNRIKSWTLNEQLQKIEIIKCVSKEIFTLNCETIEQVNYKTFNLEPLLLSPSIMKKIRLDYIEFLIKLYSDTDSIYHKLVILEIFENVIKPPKIGYEQKETKSLVKENIVYLINFYLEIIEQDTNLDIIRRMDEQINWIEKAFGPIEEILTLREKIRNNNRYEIYINLTGSDFYCLENLNFKDIEKMRIQKIKQYINSISNENEDYWIRLIIEICSNSDIENKVDYRYFKQFLHDLARNNSELSKKLITQYENDIKDFIDTIISGLRISEPKFINQKIEEWIDNERYLIDCTSALFYSDEVDIDILDKISNKAKAKKDIDTLNKVFEILNTSKVDQLKCKGLYIDIIETLSNSNNFWWTNYIRLHRESWLDKFDEMEKDKLMDILKKCPQINYNIELFLIKIAQKSPNKVIDFFKGRLEIEEIKIGINSNYESIPFYLNELADELRSSSKICIPIIFDWISEGSFILRHGASSLLKILFPKFNGDIETFFLDILKFKNVEDGESILEVLRIYDGDSSIYDFSKQFVITFEDNMELLNELMNVLSETGVVSGEYGFVESLEQKRKEIRKWNKSKNKAVKNFVKNFVDFLNSQVKIEKKRVDEQIQIRKYRFESIQK